MPEPDNGVTPEPVAQVTPEPSAAPQAPDPGVNESGKEVDPAALAKELEKVRMEANLHKNKLKEYETKEKERERSEMTELERIKAERDELAAEKTQRELREFRDDVLATHLKDNPVALKAVKALTAKNPGAFVWSEGAASREDAKAELIEQLDAFVEAIGVPAKTEEPEPNEPTYRGRSNNPAYRETSPDRAALLDEARKTGDFSKLIGEIPSVQQVVKTFE